MSSGYYAGSAHAGLAIGKMFLCFRSDRQRATGHESIGEWIEVRSQCHCGRVAAAGKAECDDCYDYRGWFR